MLFNIVQKIKAIHDLHKQVKFLYIISMNIYIIYLSIISIDLPLLEGVICVSSIIIFTEGLLQIEPCLNQCSSIHFNKNQPQVSSHGFPLTHLSPSETYTSAHTVGNSFRLMSSLVVISARPAMP